MSRYYETREGWTRGGIDIESAVNQFFKLLLLSPIFLLAIYVSLAMLKHMIFGGVPVMNQPTDSQREELRQRDAGVDPVPDFTPKPEPVPVPGAVPAPPTLPEVTQKETVPYVIYDTPQEYYTDVQKESEGVSSWGTDLLESLD